ncbi:MAG: hypothetical protein J6T10_00855 [Methanobrevibacter sp.]|nr:hypothetical protein [Methanobrevibacter sp.]
MGELKNILDADLLLTFLLMCSARTDEEKDFYETLYMVGKMDEKDFWKTTMQMWHSRLSSNDV